MSPPSFAPLISKVENSDDDLGPLAMRYVLSPDRDKHTIDDVDHAVAAGDIGLYDMRGLHAAAAAGVAAAAVATGAWGQSVAPIRAALEDQFVSIAATECYPILAPHLARRVLAVEDMGVDYRRRTYGIDAVGGLRPKQVSADVNRHPADRLVARGEDGER